MSGNFVERMREEARKQSAVYHSHLQRDSREALGWIEAITTELYLDAKVIAYLEKAARLLDAVGSQRRRIRPVNLLNSEKARAIRELRASKQRRDLDEYQLAIKNAYERLDEYGPSWDQRKRWIRRKEKLGYEELAAFLGTSKATRPPPLKDLLVTDTSANSLRRTLKLLGEKQAAVKDLDH